MLLLDPLGDYPRLEEKPFEQKDIHYPYDHPEYRRNFGEPVLLSQIECHQQIANISFEF